MEYKYGREKADHHLMMDLNSYLRTSERYQVDIIRFDYDDKEDMFDSHSYAKGGRVLHMLRKYVGDKAFFAALELYLKQHQFKAVEIHDLRLAFEQITGEDLNWFFNQWFMSSGHPKLEITYNYDDSLKKQSVFVSQLQDLVNTPLYSIPLRVDIYQGNSVVSHDIRIDSVKQAFHFNVNDKPDLVNIDGEKMLLGEKLDWKTKEEWAFQYFNGPLFLDRKEAIDQLANLKNDSIANHVIFSALNDPYWNLRLTAVENSMMLAKSNPNGLKDQLVTLAKTDPKSLVRGNAIKSLALDFPLDSMDKSGDDQLLPVFQEALEDKSYFVIGEALNAIASRDRELVFTIINDLDPSMHKKLLVDIAGIYASYGSANDNQYFSSTYKNLKRYEKYRFLNIYSNYLQKQNDSIINLGLEILEDASINHPDWWVRMVGIRSISALYEMYDVKSLLSKQTGQDNPTEPSPEEIIIQNQKAKIKRLLAKIKEQETEEGLLENWDRFSF